jgi:YbbR domain-containing protein
MKEKLTKNIGLKILSIILATILWLVITNVDDPVETRSFTDVKVEILNEDKIASLDQVYDIVQNATISFKIEARRTIRDKLSKSDFAVTADFAELSAVNSVPIKITCPLYGDEVEIVDGKYQNMQISLEEMISDNKKVDIVQKGEVAESYFIGETKASPNMIKVSGPKGRVESIAKVIVEVDVTGLSESTTKIAKPKAIDEEGKEIDSTYLTFSEDLVLVDIGIYNTKTINLQIKTSGKPASGYAMTNIEYEPKQITIAGDDRILDSILYLSISETITGATENISKEINLQDELEEGIFIVGEDKTAVINIIIEKMVTKDINIYPGDIDLKNKPNSLNTSFITMGPITASVMGLANDVSGLTRFSLKPYIDLSGFSAGTYTSELKLDQSSKLTLINKPMINFTLTEEIVSD